MMHYIGEVPKYTISNQICISKTTSEINSFPLNAAYMHKRIGVS